MLKYRKQYPCDGQQEPITSIAHGNSGCGLKETYGQGNRTDYWLLADVSPGPIPF